MGNRHRHNAGASSSESPRRVASPVSELKALTGRGVEGIAKGSGLLLQAGNSRWLNLSSDPEVQSVLSRPLTAFCFTIGGSVATVFSLEDSIRPDATSTIQTLLERSILVHINSSDDDGAIRSIGVQLNIADANIRSRYTPSDKQTYIQALLERTTSPDHTTTNEKPVVIFYGDSTNNAVALAQAIISVHINEGGTDITKSAADVTLILPNLAGILTTIDVSRKSIHRIAFNFS